MELTAALSGLLDHIAQHSQGGQDDEIRIWLMAATLRIWAKNEQMAENYVPALSVFTGDSFTTAQVKTAMECAGEAERKLKIPGFFQTLVVKDKENHTAFSWEIADSMGRFLAAAALINGDFTIREAAELKGISDQLISYIDSQGVRTGKNREHHPEMVTPLSQTGYYQESKQEPPITIDILAGPQPDPSAAGPDIQPITPIQNHQTTNQNTVTSEPGVDIKKPKIQDGETLESVLAELYGLVGLEKVKNDVQSLLNFIKICQIRTQRGMKKPTISYHLVFTGNPGTGKTTVPVWWQNFTT